MVPKQVFKLLLTACLFTSPPHVHLVVQRLHSGLASATQSVDPARVSIPVTLTMDHAAEAARLLRQANIHKRLAQLAEQRKKRDERRRNF